MQDAQLIGVFVAVFGILDIAITGLIVVPRLKMPPKVKKLMLTVNTAIAVLMIVGGAVIFFVGGD